MINADDMQVWSYLLNPNFQFINTAGKPLTEGYLEVYIAGTRNKYYCASDFDGTLHPFQIPLDSLGSNIVLADPSQAYDVYAYNRFGSLIMSRYNVSPGNTGGSGALTITISSDDDTVQVVKDGNNYDLSIADTIARIDDIEERLSEIGDGSVGYAIANAETTDDGLFNLTDDKNKDIDYTSDMHGFRLKPGHVYQLNFNAKFDCNNDTNDLISGKFYLEGDNAVAQEWQFNVDNSFEHQESFNGSTVLVIPDDVSYYDVKLKYLFDDEELDLYLNKISIVDVTSLVSQIASGINEYTEGDGINIIDNTISVDMDYINEHLDIDASSILSSAYHYTDARVSQVSGDLINIIAEVTANIPPQVQSDWNQDDDTQVDYIKNKPEEESVEFEEINLSDYALASAIPSIDGLATVAQVSSVSSVLQNEINNIPAQVQSDWAEDDASDPSYILNKPNELELVAGNNIEIEVSGTNIVISSTASAVTGLDLLYGKFTSNNVSATATMAKSKGNINVSEGKIQLEQGKSYHITVRGYYQQTSAVNSYTPISYVEYITSKLINIDIDRSRTDAQYFELSYDLYNLNSDTDYQVAFSGCAGLVKDLIVEVHSLGGAGTVSSSGVSAIEYDAGYGINIANQVISVDSSIIPEIPESANLIPGNNITITASGNDYVISSTASCTTYTPGNGIDITNNEISIDNTVALKSEIPDVSNLATKTEVQAVSSAIPTLPEEEEVDFEEIDLSNYALASAIPDVSSLATKVEVATATGDLQSQINNLPSQVQANWTESDDSDPSYILNKPEELNLVGGDNITITVSGSSAIINGQAGGGTTYTEGDYIDITNNVISVDTSDVVDIVPGSNVTITVSGSSAIISSTGEPQVQSDWNVTDSSSKAYIKNKPTIPAAQVQSNWNETNSSSKAYIQNKPTIHTYTGASGVNISNDVVSLDNPIGLVPGTNVTIEVSGSSAVINADSPTLASLNTAGISDIQVVNALPASPVATVLYLIPEV